MADIKPEDLKEIKNEFLRIGISFADRHTHSINKYTESFDISKEPLEGPFLEVVDFADKAGFDEIAITDHSYEILLYPKMEERTILQSKFGEETIDKYVKYIEEVKKRYNNIKVLGGIEIKLRTMSDLEYIPKTKLQSLDFIMIETLLKKPDFNKIREKFGKDTIIIFAHPDPRYNLEESFTEEDILDFVDEMSKNKIHFDLNRQFLDKYLSDDPLYKSFFKVAAEKGILFSTGSDYHGRVQNYVKYFSKTLKVIKKYNLNKDNFLRFEK